MKNLFKITESFSTQFFSASKNSQIMRLNTFSSFINCDFIFQHFRWTNDIRRWLFSFYHMNSSSFVHLIEKSIQFYLFIRSNSRGEKDNLSTNVRRSRRADYSFNINLIFGAFIWNNVDNEHQWTDWKFSTALNYITCLPIVVCCEFFFCVETIGLDFKLIAICM